MSAPDAGRGAPQAPAAFHEPWEAQAFALTLALHEQGLFTWPEWAQALSAALERQTDERPYYQCWLAALERLTAEKGLVGAADLNARKESWRRAAHATPHGSPILLENDPPAR